MEDKDEKEKIEEIAIMLKPIMDICDTIIERFDFEQADKSLVKMKSHVSKLEAGSIIGTALGVDVEAKIRKVQLTNETYEAVVNLLTCRRAQKENALKSADDSQLNINLAKQMGWL